MLITIETGLKSSYLLTCLSLRHLLVQLRPSLCFHVHVSTSIHRLRSHILVERAPNSKDLGLAILPVCILFSLVVRVLRVRFVKLTTWRAIVVEEPIGIHVNTLLDSRQSLLIPISATLHSIGDFVNVILFEICFTAIHVRR